MREPRVPASAGRSGLDEVALPADVPAIDGYVDLAIRGGFPEVVHRDRSERARRIWLDSYLEDLVTRDAALVGEPDSCC